MNNAINSTKPVPAKKDMPILPRNRHERRAVLAKRRKEGKVKKRKARRECIRLQRKAQKLRRALELGGGGEMDISPDLNVGIVPFGVERLEPSQPTHVIIDGETGELLEGE